MTTSPDEDRRARLGRSVWTALLPLWLYAVIVGVLAAGLGLVAALITDIEPRLYVQLAVAAVVACAFGLAYPVVLDRLRRAARRRS